MLGFIEDLRKEQVTVTENKSEGKLHCYLKNSIPMFNMNLVHRRVTSVSQKVPKNAVEIAEQFLEDMKNIGEFVNLANMDETPCYFDIPRSSTIGKKRGTDS